MNDILKQFWNWLGVEPELYARNGIDYNYINCNSKEECDFPCFDDLIIYAESIVNKNILSKYHINELIVIMAIDNESEHLLDYIVKNSSPEQLDIIINIGITHSFFEARWQVAEILFRRKPTNYIEYLFSLSNDTHPYVKQRASNCLAYLE